MLSMDSTQWRAKSPANPFVFFGLLYVGLFVVYGLYAFGVWALMAKVIFVNRTWDNDNFIGPLIVIGGGLVIVILSNTEIEKEREKTRSFLKIIEAHESILDSLYNVLAIKSNGYTSRQITYGSGSAIFELTMMTAISLVMLLWQFSTPRPTANQGDEMLNIFTKQVIGFQSDVKIIFTNIVSGSTSYHWGKIMLTAIQSKVITFDENNITKSGVVAVNPSIERARERCSEFIIQTQTGKWWWILVATRVFSVLFMLAVPFLLWTTQGILIIVWSEVVFLIFHSLPIYRMFLSNVLMSPTKWDMGVIINRIVEYGQTADKKYATFAQHMTSSRLDVYPKTLIRSIVSKYLLSASDTIYHEQ